MTIEVPEAWAAAVEVVARAIHEAHNGDFAVPADNWDTVVPFVKASKRQEARAALAALVAPTRTPCAPCFGTGAETTEFVTHAHDLKRCPACNGCGFVEGPPPILAVLGAREVAVDRDAMLYDVMTGNYLTDQDASVYTLSGPSLPPKEEQ